MNFASHLRLGLTREIQPDKNCSNSNMCFSHGHSWVVYSRTNRKPVVNFTFFTNLRQTLTFNSYIKSHKNIRIWLKKYNQIWHGIKANKNIVVNHNFTPTMSKWLRASGPGCGNLNLKILVKVWSLLILQATIYNECSFETWHTRLTLLGSLSLKLLGNNDFLAMLWFRWLLMKSRLAMLWYQVWKRTWIGWTISFVTELGFLRRFRQGNSRATMLVDEP